MSTPTTIHAPDQILQYAPPDPRQHTRGFALACAILCFCSTLAVVIAHQLHKPQEILRPEWWFGGGQMVPVRVQNSHLLQRPSLWPTHLHQQLPLVR